MKKLYIFMVTILMVLILSIPLYAGSSTKEKIENFLFKVPLPPVIILNPHNDRFKRESRHYRYRNTGYWEIKRVWTPPVYERAWIEGYYITPNTWQSGRYEMVLLRHGYWVNTRVWVRY